MLRTTLALAIVLATGSAQAKMEIENVQAAYGPLGPERKNLDLYPVDELHFRFVVTGARVQDDGKVDALLISKLSDAAGKVLLEDKRPFRGVLAFGGQSFVCTTALTLQGGVKPGEYTWHVTVKDNVSGEEASFERKLTCKPLAFAVVAPQFFFDAEGKVPAPAGGTIGQHLHLRFRAVGADFSRGELDTTMEARVLDAEGKETMPKPLTFALRSKDPAVVKMSGGAVNFNAFFSLNRTGEFTLRIVVTDRIGNKTAQLELPVRITAP